MSVQAHQRGIMVQQYEVPSGSVLNAKNHTLNSMHPFAALDQPPTMDIKARKELADAASSCAGFLTVELENPYNAFVWKAVMQGPVGSPYHGADLHMRVVFGGQGDSSQTPMALFAVPQQVYHPNVRTDGKIMLDPVKHRFGSTSAAELFAVIRAALVSPQMSAPKFIGNPAAAAQYNADRAGFAATAQATWKAAEGLTDCFPQRYSRFKDAASRRPHGIERPADEVDWLAMTRSLHESQGSTQPHRGGTNRWSVCIGSQTCGHSNTGGMSWRGGMSGPR